MISFNNWQNRNSTRGNDSGVKESFLLLMRYKASH
jgi:hypothetical protein